MGVREKIFESEGLMAVYEQEGGYADHSIEIDGDPLARELAEVLSGRPDLVDGDAAQWGSPGPVKGRWRVTIERVDD